jgi:hypothetical protein
MPQDQLDIISQTVDELLDVTGEHTESINVLNQSISAHDRRLETLENIANDDIEEVIKDYLEKNPP